VALIINVIAHAGFMFIVVLSVCLSFVMNKDD